MRILMLASYFPKPGNPLMGNWALAQAQAFLRAGMSVSVVSGTSWIPNLLARSPGMQAYANCPATYQWGDLPASYPRWPLYPVKSLRSTFLTHPAPLLGATWVSIRKHLVSAVERLQPDIVYGHHTQVNGYLAWRLQQTTGLPYVITDHDFGEIEDCRSHPARRRFFAPVVAGCSRMVAVASRMAAVVEELFPGARCLTVHNGSDPPRAAVFTTPRPKHLQDRLVIFSACAFYERKGIPLLIRAFARIASRFPEAVLRIAGSGETGPEIEKTAADAALGSQLELLGRLPHDQVLQQMAWSDVFALPGWDEPFATAFTEALSVGCPIVYSSDGGITDVVSNGVHGIAVEPRSEASVASALETLLCDRQRRRAMGVAARQLFDSKMHWDHHARQMETVFRQAIAAKAS